VSALPYYLTDEQGLLIIPKMSIQILHYKMIVLLLLRRYRNKIQFTAFLIIISGKSICKVFNLNQWKMKIKDMKHEKISLAIHYYFIFHFNES